MEVVANVRTNTRLYKDEVRIVLWRNPNRKGWTILNKSPVFTVRVHYDGGFGPTSIPPGALLEVPMIEYIGRVRAEVIGAVESGDFADIDVVDFTPFKTDTDGRQIVTP